MDLSRDRKCKQMNCKKKKERKAFSPNKQVNIPGPDDFIVEFYPLVNDQMLPILLNGL
jgi:hypothetical protein